MHSRNAELKCPKCGEEVVIYGNAEGIFCGTCGYKIYGEMVDASKREKSDH